MRIKMEEQTQDQKANIVGRWLLEGKLRILSPLIIGSSTSLSAASDLEMLKNKEGTVFIPSSSITGALKHAFADYKYKGDRKDYDTNQRRFWGGTYQYEKDKKILEGSSQSAMVISDLTLSDKVTSIVTIRDGIKIDFKTMLVEDEHKFNYEVLEPGALFNFKMEVIHRDCFDEFIFDSLVKWVGYMLQNGKIPLGAKTGQGFGKCKLEDIKYCKLNYKKLEDIYSWLERDYHWQDAADDFFSIKNFACEKKIFTLKAEFFTKDSIIIGAYPGTPEESDKVHLDGYNQQGEAIKVIPGTSIRGAIRSRAEKIAKTLDIYDEASFHQLFGWVETSEDKKETKAIKSKIMIEESQLKKDNYKEELQHRIRIDRFTGGVINNALFDSTPLWSSEKDKTKLTIKLSIKEFNDWEAGLMLLVLKDLWSGDLPLGGEKGIGRGVLIGSKAEIGLGERIITIEQIEEKKLRVSENNHVAWDENAANALEELVAAFHSYQKGNGVINNGS